MRDTRSVSEHYCGIALSALGLEKVLAAELERIGIPPSSRAPGRVFFQTDEAGLFRANLCLRTAERILLEAARFPAHDFDELFEGARRPLWEQFFHPEDRLIIERVRTHASALSAQTSIQSVVHKAIYEHLSRNYHLRRLPETGRPRSLRVYLEEDECVLGLDLSGEALHKRGYRRATGEAPLKETLAAAMLLLAGYRRNLPFLDPFCGSGTILIEAALFALDRAPGLDRSFELETMPLTREGGARFFAAEREAARARVRRDPDIFIAGSDSDGRSLELARANAMRAGVGPLVELRQAPAEALRPPAPRGIVLTNPPYGLRMGTEAEAEALYRRLGERFGAVPGVPASDFRGWGLGFVTNRPDFGAFFGRRAPVEHHLVNGAEEQWFHWYPAGWEDRPIRAPAAESRPRGEAGKKGGAELRPRQGPRRGPAGAGRDRGRE